MVGASLLGVTLIVTWLIVTSSFLLMTLPRSRPHHGSGSSLCPSSCSTCSGPVASRRSLKASWYWSDWSSSKLLSEMPKSASSSSASCPSASCSSMWPFSAAQMCTAILCTARARVRVIFSLESKWAGGAASSAPFLAIVSAPQLPCIHSTHPPFARYFALASFLLSSSRWLGIHLTAIGAYLFARISAMVSQ